MKNSVQLTDSLELRRSGELIYTKPVRGRRHPVGKRFRPKGDPQQVSVNGVSRPLRRVMWEAFNGPVPMGHRIINTSDNPSNNALRNLQCVPDSEINSSNQLGTSMFKGVCWNVKRSVWQAYMHRKRYKQYLGAFENEEEAARAYDDYARSIGLPERLMNFPNE